MKRNITYKNNKINISIKEKLFSSAHYPWTAIASVLQRVRMNSDWSRSVLGVCLEKRQQQINDIKVVFMESFYFIIFWGIS